MPTNIEKRLELIEEILQYMLSIAISDRYDEHQEEIQREFLVRLETDT